jgi:hypothetical protein
MEGNNLISEIARKLGQRGGQSTSSRYGKDYFRELQKKSVESRKSKKNRA